MNHSEPAFPTSARSYHQVLTRLLRQNALPQLRKVVDKTAAADIAPVVPLLEAEDLARFVSILADSGKAAEVMLQLEPEEIAEVVEKLDDALLAGICSSSASDDAADLLDAMEEERRQRVLGLLESSRGAKLESLLVRDDEETAGSLMTTEYLAIEDSETVARAIEAIRHYPRKDAFFYVYAIDGHGHLAGVLSLRNLILAQPETSLRETMVQNVVRTTIDATQEEVAQLVAKYDLLSIPVVDAQNRLVGVVTVDDVLDVIQEEAEEDLFHLAGVDTADRVGSSATTSFRMRIPWLIVNLGTAFVAASVVRSFEGTIQKWAALAAFMPIVAGMGGNAATQTLTVFVRGLAFDEVDWKSGLKPILKELRVGLCNGLVIGILTGLIVGFWTGDWRLGLILPCAMIVNLVVAGIAGAVVPLALKELDLDPAIASSIFVTTFTDVCGFFAFLGLATLALSYWP